MKDSANSAFEIVDGLNQDHNFFITMHCWNPNVYILVCTTIPLSSACCMNDILPCLITIVCGIVKRCQAFRALFLWDLLGLPVAGLAVYWERSTTGCLLYRISMVLCLLWRYYTFPLRFWLQKSTSEIIMDKTMLTARKEKPLSPQMDNTAWRAWHTVHNQFNI